MKKALLIPIALLAMQANAKTLVAYFSATGITKAAAQDVARVGGFDLWEIEAYEPYTAADLDWRNQQSRSSIEMNDPEERPTIRICTDLRPYDTIYLGFPIWWGICPRIIQSWVENNLLDGKTLIPFATSGSSTIDKAVQLLRETYPQYRWQDGKLLNEYTDQTLTDWINSAH
ncbi:MAG: flavodoxin [Paludibacteraceae bacterium]|nr:flavodoxin [Paludibacteraceae bacterium]